jgi:hypothetical protein
MASVARRLRRNAAAKRAHAPGLMFRAVSRLRGSWTRDVGLPFLEAKYEREGLSHREYRFYLRRSNDLARWEAGKS